MSALIGEFMFQIVKNKLQMGNILFDIQYLLKNKREWVVAILIGIFSIAWLMYSGEAGSECL